jgi:hypothetical protein
MTSPAAAASNGHHSCQMCMRAQHGMQRLSAMVSMPAPAATKAAQSCIQLLLLSFFAVLCCAVLCCAVLCCAVLLIMA